jgi:hypothetical protein
MADVLVLGAAGKEFVADGKNGGGDDSFIAHWEYPNMWGLGLGSAVLPACKPLSPWAGMPN